jgi:hypothetical protein
MTKAEGERLARMEVHVSNLIQTVDAISRDVKTLVSAHDRREGDDRAQHRLSARAWAIIAALFSLFSGGVGAVVAKKIG